MDLQSIVQLWGKGFAVSRIYTLEQSRSVSSILNVFIILLKFSKSKSVFRSALSFVTIGSIDLCWISNISLKRTKSNETLTSEPEDVSLQYGKPGSRTASRPQTPADEGSQSANSLFMSSPNLFKSMQESYTFDTTEIKQWDKTSRQVKASQNYTQTVSTPSAQTALRSGLQVSCS